MKVRQEVYDTYWQLAAERQAIFFRRLDGQAGPYTADPILQRYKFCNAYRASDRVSQFLIHQVIYDGASRSPADTLFRIFLFRLFNKVETWTALEAAVGEILLDSFDFEVYALAIEAIRSGQPIYGNAFILCANKAFGFDQKHRNHLALLESVFGGDMAERLLAAGSLEKLFWLLRQLPLMGNFMAYQVAIDMNYAEVFDFDENAFTVAGPGAVRGITKCFDDLEGASYTDAIMHMVIHQDEEFARLGLDFLNLGGRKLHAIDCQGLFCETDKYCRVKFPDLKSNRSRIKATYSPTARSIEYFYPPKWDVIL